MNHLLERIAKVIFFSATYRYAGFNSSGEWGEEAEWLTRTEDRARAIQQAKNVLGCLVSRMEELENDLEPYTWEPEEEAAVFKAWQEEGRRRLGQEIGSALFDTNQDPAVSDLTGRTALAAERARQATASPALQDPA